MMKRLLAFLFIWILLAGLWGPVCAAEEPRIRVGLLSKPSESAVRPDSAYEALLVESLQEISKYTNWQFDFILEDESVLLEMLAQSQIDLIAGLYYRNALESQVAYPRYVTGYTYALLVSSPENDDIHPNDYHSMQDKTIAAEASSKEAQRLLGYLSLNSIQSDLLYTENTATSLAMLDRGEVDMALVTSNDARGYRVITRFVVEPYYIVTAAGNQPLLDQLDAAYAMILESDASFVDKLYQRHFDTGMDSGIRLTQQEREAIAQMDPLRIAVADGFAPLQSFANGDARGINIDILQHIAEQSGLAFEYMYAGGISDALALMQSGQADAMFCLSFPDKMAADHNLVMTNQFLNVYRIALCNKYIEYPSSGLTLALIPGMDYLVDDYTANIVYADSFVDCITMVNNGSADYTYGSTFFVEYGLQERVFHNIQNITLPRTFDYVTIGLSKPVSPMLLTILNKTINNISDETYQDIVLRNTALKEQEQSLASFIYSYPMLFAIIFCVLTGLIIVVSIVFALLRARHSRALYQTQYTDELTGVLNLPGFRRVATRLLQSPTRYALSYSTIKGFSYINDRYGYEEGDNVLRRIAQAYRVDMRENEAFCRVSGGTFVALRVYDTLDHLLERLDAFHDQLHKITPQADPNYHLSMPTGIYLGEKNGKQPDVFGMMDRANAAQQQIKSSADAKYMIYREGIFDNMMHAQEIESRMESALELGEFLVYLQPKHELATLKPAGAEALVRWCDGDRIIPPSEFIPQFERNGFIAKLDRHMFTQCCRLLRYWMDHGMPYVPISVNVSRVQLYASDFIDSYVSIKQSYGIPDGLLELEFTESIIFEEVDRLITIVRTLRQNGFECSIDDFGKGYSSLTMLKNIPADVIKLDAQFFDSGIDRQRDTIIIESIVDIAKSLGMISVAEGIEHQQQVRVLQMIGCDMAQGYVFSKPLDIPTFERYLRHKLLIGDDPFSALPAEELEV